MTWIEVKNLKSPVATRAFDGTLRMNGSLQLSEYPGDLVRLSCEKCGRSGDL
jgi:NAD-dependent SIR2 family protein deacetylase